MQFRGAGNDNILKFALTVMVTYPLPLDWLPPATDPAVQLEPLQRDLAQPEAGARQHRRLPLGAGHLLAVVLRQRLPGVLPGFAREVLHGDEGVASLLLVVLSAGIGMTLSSVDLYFATRALPASSLLPVGGFLAPPRPAEQVPPAALRECVAVLLAA